MRILEMNIYDDRNEMIRNIKFNQSGINFIYGDVAEPESKKGTINSIGKTNFLKCIDYILGSNESSKLTSKEVNGYKLKAKVLFKQEIFDIERVIGNSNMIVDGEEYRLEDYKKRFGINRKYYGKQIILEPKGNILGYNKSTTKDDISVFLEMINFDKLSKAFMKVTDNQDDIKVLKSQKKSMIELLDDINENEVDQEIFFINQKIAEYEDSLQKLMRNIEDLDINDEQSKVLNEYQKLNESIKNLKYEKLKLTTENKSMLEFIEESQNLDIKNKHIVKLYEKANIEVPEMVRVKLSEVEEFHKKMYIDRKKFLEDQIIKKTEEIINIDKELRSFDIELKKLADIIKINEAYIESIKLIENYNNKLKELKYQQGRLSQIEDIEKEIKSKDEELHKDFIEVENKLKEKEQEIEEIKEYINKFVKEIYDDDVYAFFNINSRVKHQRNNPLKIKLELKGEGGEGIAEVKKIIMDYIIFKMNNYTEILIHDSSCYNGIDNRQTVNMLKKLHEIAIKSDKQAIISINKYQVSIAGDEDSRDVYNFIDTYTVLKLNEKEKLFKIDF